MRVTSWDVVLGLIAAVIVLTGALAVGYLLDWAQAQEDQDEVPRDDM